MKLNLEHRVALVTGATGGIGTAIATELFHQGAKVVLTGRNIEKLNTIRNQLVASPQCPPQNLSVFHWI